MYSSHFIPVITDATRCNNNTSSIRDSLLDHIWVNQLFSYKSGIVINDLTDHYPTYIQLPFTNRSKCNEKVKVTFREASSENESAFLNLVNNFNWDLIKTTDPNTYT